MASEKLQVILELVTGAYKREAKAAATATGQIGSSATSLTGQLGKLIGPAAIGGAVLGLGKMALAAGENADRLFDLQAQTGLSTDALQQWEFVAKAAGAETEVFSDAVKAIVKNLSEAASGTGAAAKAYERLGISVKDANGNLREGGEITAEVFDKLAGMENITARNALAQDIFGKKWEETISILDLGTEALGNLREEGKKGVVSAEALRNADKFREAWQKFVATVGPKLNEILGKIAPSLTDIAEGAADAVEDLAPFVEQIVTLGGWVLKLRRDTDDLSDSQSGFNRFIGDGVDILEGMINPLKAWDNLMGVLNPKLEENAAVVGEVHDSWNLAAAAASGAARGIEDVGDAAGRAAPKVKTLADRQKELADRLLAQSSPLFAAIDSWDSYAETLERVDEDGARTNEELFELAGQTLETNAALADLGGGNLERGIQSLATALGLPRDVIVDMLKQLGILNNTTARPRVILDVVSAITGRDSASSGGGSGRTYIGGKQHGGPVRGGTPYLVGERGPEIMVPSQSGTVLPNGWRGGSTTINVNSPTNNLRQDLQYATLLASVTNLVEGF